MDGQDQASYVALHRRGELARRAETAVAALAHCLVCAQACGPNRLAGELGVCRTGRYAVISGYGPHFGEEEPLTGRHGSGTIFFGHCNLTCLFCQNHDISCEGVGEEVKAADLADIMLDLQARGCHNVNLVSPSHVVPQILEALNLAAEGGLRIPLVYNTGGYDALPTLRWLDGVVDIYMPDLKFADARVAEELAGARNYPAAAKAAIKEMHRQVGDLVVNEEGIARRGLLLRHLVLPEGLAGTAELMEFVATELSRDTYVNLMDQYYPAHRAQRRPPLNRRITPAEYREAMQAAREAGLWRFA
ncbi:MAG: radical SAM protein [Bacillota bacterium]|nr:radical SAM protein [Bacillota bacterium]